MGKICIFAACLIRFQAHFYSVIKQGKCMKQVQDVIERLWDFIDKLDINTFGKSVPESCSSITVKNFESSLILISILAPFLFVFLRFYL